MPINSFSDSLSRDIVPNRAYLRSTGKIVSVVIFFFANKVVAKASHACRINARCNGDYLFSSCFESIEICFSLPAQGSGCHCFLASDSGEGKRKDTYCDVTLPAGLPAGATSRQNARRALRAAACGRSTGQQVPSPSSRSNSHSQNHWWLTKCFESRPLPLGAETLLLLRVYLSLSKLCIHGGRRQYQKRESKDNHGVSEK